MRGRALPGPLRRSCPLPRECRGACVIMAPSPFCNRRRALPQELPVRGRRRHSLGRQGARLDLGACCRGLCSVRRCTAGTATSRAGGRGTCTARAHAANRLAKPSPPLAAADRCTPRGLTLAMSAATKSAWLRSGALSACATQESAREGHVQPETSWRWLGRGFGVPGCRRPSAPFVGKTSS